MAETEGKKKKIDVEQAAKVGLAAGQLVTGIMQKKKADSLIPSAEDKMSRGYLEEIRRKQRAIETGSSSDRAALRQNLAALNNASFKSGRGASTGAISRIMAEQNKNIADANAQKEIALLGEAGKQVSEMALRRFDVGMIRQQQAAADSAKNIAAGQANLLASGKKSSKKKKDKGTQVQDNKSV